MKVFVYGWYNHGNLGDEAFKPAIKELFPKIDFQFGDTIPKKINEEYDALFVGGGSFIDQRIKGIETVKIPIGFIGIGIGHSIEPANAAAIKRALFVVVRDHLSAKRCPNAFLAPDLVFSRTFEYPAPDPASKKVLVLLNDFLSPKQNNQDWQSLSFYRFTLELAKTCDSLASRGYLIQFVPMCITSGIDDRRVAAAVIGRMKETKKTEWFLDKTISEPELLTRISQSHLVITQRFHGAIYSVLLNKPFIVIRCHDKLKGLVEDCDWPGHVDYYGFTDQQFFKVYEQVKTRSVEKSYVEYARRRWTELAELITEKLNGIAPQAKQLDKPPTKPVS